MRRVILAIVSTAAALVMVLSFKSHGTASLATPPAALSTSTGTGSTGTSSGTGSTSMSSGSSSTSTSKRPTSKSPASKSSTTTTTKTVTGNAVDTRYGPVQVEITVSGGKVTAATAVAYPMNDPRDQQINSYAIPTLNQEAVQAGNANIQMVSGATYTSEGYIQSLQSALNKA